MPRAYNISKAVWGGGGGGAIFGNEFMLEANTKGNKNMFPRHFAIKLKLASRRHMDSRRRY